MKFAYALFVTFCMLSFDFTIIIIIAVTGHVPCRSLHINWIKFIWRKNIINDWFFIKYLTNPFYLVVFNMLISFIFIFTIKSQSLSYKTLLNLMLKILFGFLLFSVKNSKNICKKVCWTWLITQKRRFTY